MKMTVRDLKATLNALPEEFDDLLVVMSRDAEGNSYSPLCDWASTYYSPSERDIYDLDDLDSDDREWAPEDTQKVLVLWPTI